MTLKNILVGLAVWTLVSVVLGLAIGRVLGFCAGADTESIRFSNLNKAA